MAKVEGMVKISAQEYLKLLQRSADLSALEGAGVDNWENYCEVEPRSDAEDAAILAKVVGKIVE